MAGFVFSKDSNMYMDDSGGTLREITAYVTGVDGLPGEVELQDITVFGDGGHKFIPGLKNAQFGVDFFYNSDPSTSGGFLKLALAIFGSTVTKSFEFYPGGSSGQKLSGECWLQTLPLTSRVGETVAGTASFQVDGVVTIA